MQRILMDNVKIAVIFSNLHRDMKTEEKVVLITEQFLGAIIFIILTVMEVINRDSEDLMFFLFLVSISRYLGMFLCIYQSAQ